MTNKNIRDLSGWKRGQPQRIINREKIKEKIALIVEARTKALASTLYLSGSRISEIVGGKTKHTKKDGSVKERVLQGFRPDQITQVKYKGSKYYVLEGLPVAKKRNEVLYRRVLVLPEDNDLVAIVLDYAADKDVKKPLFDFSRVRAWQLLSQALPDDPLFNHYFRHFHVTHRLHEDGFDVSQTGKEMAWKNMSHLMTYDARNINDLLELAHTKKEKKE